MNRLHTTQTSAEFTWATMAYTDGAVPGNFAMLVLKVHIVAPEIVLHHRHFQEKNPLPWRCVVITGFGPTISSVSGLNIGTKSEDGCWHYLLLRKWGNRFV